MPIKFFNNRLGKILPRKTQSPPTAWKFILVSDKFDNRTKSARTCTEKSTNLCQICRRTESTKFFRKTDKIGDIKRESTPTKFVRKWWIQSPPNLSERACICIYIYPKFVKRRGDLKFRIAWDAEDDKPFKDRSQTNNRHANQGWEQGSRVCRPSSTNRARSNFSLLFHFIKLHSSLFGSMNFVINLKNDNNNNSSFALRWN